MQHGMVQYNFTNDLDEHVASIFLVRLSQTSIEQEASYDPEDGGSMFL
jgi:hypothetical protein